MINPVSKISVLAVHSSTATRHDMTEIVYRSSLVAAGILLAIMLFGEVILHSIFHIELYSLRVSGGLVLLWAGFNALQKGMFFEQGTQQSFRDLAIVPLACPMIAGPATIVASASLSTQIGMTEAILAMLLAVAINALIMRFAGTIANLLKRFNILGALIRITGLIVMTIGAEMILTGLSTWIRTHS